MKKLRKTFIKREYEFRLCKSNCVPISIDPNPQEIVLGRLDGAIRRLFGATASIRFLYNEEYRLSEGGERL